MLTLVSSKALLSPSDESVRSLSAKPKSTISSQDCSQTCDSGVVKLTPAI